MSETFAPRIAVEDLPPEPSALERVGLTFTSPSRAFSGPGLARSWWAPFVLILIISLGYIATIGATVGWDTVARNNLAAAPKQQARFEKSTPEQQQAQITVATRITKVVSYLTVVLLLPLFAAICAGALLATLNFAFGGHASFGSLFSLWIFVSLPKMIQGALAAALLWMGVGRDTFLLSYPVGSNPAYFMHEGGTSPALLSLLSWFDVFTIWQIVLLIIGCSVVARMSRGKAAAAVLLWTVLLMVLFTAGAAFS